MDAVSTDPILALRGVRKRFGAQDAVAGVTLSIPRGSFFSLLGPSGCGKTTTLRMIAGFESPDEGEIHLGGGRIDHLPPYRRNVNTVFQNYALFPHLTVRGNVEFGLRRKGIAEIASRVEAALDQVRLSGKASRMPSQLSGGERQRVALARALVLQPDVLLLDEPLSALDPQLRKQVRAELKDLQRRAGITFLFVTHDQEEALSMSDTIAVMNGGKVEQAGSPQEIYRRPRTRFVASFVGAMNWIDGAGLRPEVLRICRTPEAGSRLATVTVTTFLGPVMHVEARFENGETCVAEVSANGGIPFRQGERVHIGWNSADELRFEGS